ncbi:hypothetical protein GCM10011579_033520 [Streptomyces albiflavescens]|uniref:Uncharacterized protein n=1 Tax=Streptomyces albiflavescens TaxID=1623582 RepID=A0A917Y3R5_9ACTN|nr:hypothetical protein [Streptomyces albiflavescens]GGN64279.1 hypothetical protein GCM10011579_033520 [Streptomyces albiflavescens]
MFDFGIAGYQPAWLSGCSDMVREHGHRLRDLAGRTLTRVWMVWDLHDDEWFCDCPVLFDFEGEQVEINHHKLGDLSLTWNTIDPTRPVRWPDFDLEWRSEPLSELEALRGLVLKGAELLEWTCRDAAQGNVDVSFAFETGRVTVFNALDENGLSFDSPRPSQRSHLFR